MVSTLSTPIIKDYLNHDPKLTRRRPSARHHRPMPCKRCTHWNGSGDESLPPLIITRSNLSKTKKAFNDVHIMGVYVYKWIYIYILIRSLNSYVIMHIISFYIYIRKIIIYLYVCVCVHVAGGGEISCNHILC